MLKIPVLLFVLSSMALAQTPLDGTRWTLAAYAQGPRFVQVASSIGATAEFTEGRIGGNTGCNSFGGNYALEGKTLRIGPLVQTLMACPTDTLNTLERAYIQALGRVRSYTLERGILRLKNQAGQTLLILARAHPQAILGEWAVTALSTGSAIISVVDGTRPTLTFGSARIGGSTGCNQFSASYSLEGFYLEVGPVANTKRACLKEEAGRQEIAFLLALENVVSFRIVGSRLTLYDKEGKILVNLSR